MTRIFTLLVFLMIGVGATAQLSVTPGDTTLCEGESISYSASGMTLIGWIDTLNQDSAQANSFVFDASAEGTHTLLCVGFTPFPADTDSVTVTITVVAAPDLSVMSTGGTVLCEGESTSLIASSATATSYMWSPSSGLDTTTTDTVVATPSQSTTYMVEVENAAGCTATDSVSITVNANPVLSISSSASDDNDYVCSGSSATLEAVASGTLTYTWSPTATLNDSTSQTVMATPTSQTQYTVEVTDSNGCTASANYTLKVNTVYPTVSIELSDSAICPGSSSDISVLSNGTKFEWAASSSLSSLTSSNVTATPTTTTTYTVTITRDGCEVTEDVTVVVLPAPNMSATQSSGGSTICLDQTDEITVTCAECDYYVWTLPSSTLTTTQTTQVVSPNVAGAIDVDIKGYDDAGCWDLETVTINVDSCFIGTPYGIGENATPKVVVATLGSRVTITTELPAEGVELFNLLGEQVASSNISETNYSFDLSGYGSGIYLAKVRIGGTDQVSKIYLR